MLKCCLILFLWRSIVLLLPQTLDWLLKSTNNGLLFYFKPESMLFEVTKPFFQMSYASNFIVYRSDGSGVVWLWTTGAALYDLLLSEILSDTDMLELTVAHFWGSGTQPMLAHILSFESLLRMNALLGHPHHYILFTKDQRGLLSVNAFYMNVSLFLGKFNYSSKQSSIEGQTLNLQPDGPLTLRQTRELQFALKV